MATPFFQLPKTLEPCLTPVSHTPQLSHQRTLPVSPPNVSRNQPLLSIYLCHCQHLLPGWSQDSPIRIPDSAQVWPWTSYLTSLSLSFSICKQGQWHAHHRFVEGLNKLAPVETLSTGLAYHKHSGHLAVIVFILIINNSQLLCTWAWKAKFTENEH